MSSEPNPASVVMIELENIQVLCVKCKRPLEGYTIITVKGVKRLMSPGAIIYHIKMACVHCGELFRWNEDEKSLQKDAKIFMEVLSVLHGQK